MATEAGARIELESTRFRLVTPGGDEDVAAFRRWAGDPRIMRPLNLPARELTAEQAAGYLRGFDRRARFLFVVLDKDSGRRIGFWNLQIHPVHRTCSLHLAIGEPAFWGRGVTQEAGVTLIDWLFGDQGVEKIVLSVPETNRRMINVLDKLGWPKEALLEAELASAYDGSRLGEHRFGLLKAGWPAVRAKALALAERRPGA